MTEKDLTQREQNLLRNDIPLKVLLENIPFAAASIASLFERGSYNAKLAEQTASSIRHDVEWCLLKLERGER